MYVCVCKAVTEPELVQAIEENGWQSLKAVRDGLGVMKTCGACCERCKEVLAEVLVDI